MKGRWAVIVSAGLGAGMMYMLDPQRGRRRRALMRDRMVHSLRTAGDTMEVTRRDLGNRAQGWEARMRSWFSAAEPVDDQVLVERVRSQIGRVVAHPASVHVAATDGTILLNGLVLASELDDLIDCVAAVPGVRSVENHLEVHQSSAHIPGLQGEPARRGQPRSEMMQGNWSPAARLSAAVAGGALTLYGMGWHGMRRALLGSAGLTLLARAVSNLELSRMTGLFAGHRAIDVHKTINIHAPVERVFDLWSHFENMPHFMSHVREVRHLDERRTHWVVEGPGGVAVEWDALTTRIEPNRCIAWQTEPGSPVKHAGTVWFTPRPDGSTAVDVRLSYNPIAGGLGHAVASLFGADPQSRMNDDLMRMKSFVETGIPPRDAAAAAAESRYH